jgi:phage shock protein PspC (stress-responsive transcriptional regulator)
MKRSKSNKIIAGICGGMSKSLGINAWFFRILFLIIGGGFWIYLLMWVFINEEEQNDWKIN